MSKQSATRWLAALGLALGLTLGAASAAAESGEAVVLEKDLVARTLVLDGGITLYVTNDTEIVDRNGSPVSFENIPATRRVQGGLLESDGDELVEYNARQSGNQMVAEQIRVMGVLIR